MYEGVSRVPSPISRAQIPLRPANGTENAVHETYADLCAAPPDRVAEARARYVEAAEAYTAELAAVEAA